MEGGTAGLAQALSIDLSGQVAIVTGGTRGLGRDIAAALAQAGARVVAFARNAPEAPIDGVSFLPGDIRDAEGLKKVFTEYAPDGVIHLAAESHVDRSISDPMAFVNTNVIGTVTLLNAARDACPRAPRTPRAIRPIRP